MQQLVSFLQVIVIRLQCLIPKMQILYTRYDFHALYKLSERNITQHYVTVRVLLTPRLFFLKNRLYAEASKCHKGILHCKHVSLIPTYNADHALPSILHRTNRLICGSVYETSHGVYIAVENSPL